MPGLPVTAVDTHAHIFEPGLPVAADARYVPEYAATLGDYLEVLDAHGMSHGVLVQPSFLGTDNSYLLEALARHPERLRGVIVVDDGKLERELSEERVRHLDAAGVRGVRLNLLGKPLPQISEARWQLAGRIMQRHGWHLEIQASAQQWVALGPALAQWPALLVIDHLGLPDAAVPEGRAAVLQLAARDNAWVKVSGCYRSTPEGASFMVSELLAAGAGERMVFGSDWPFTRHEDNDFGQLNAWAREAVGADHFQQLFSDNASRLFALS